MATKKNTKKGRTTRRPTKAELERQKAIKRMIATFVLALILLFAAIKLGAFGVTIYNMIRLLVGSLAYLAILASFGYLFFFKWLHKHEGTVSGFISLFLGLELIFQAYFVSVLKLEGAAVLSTTLGRVLTDLTAFKVTSFAGGGLLGSLLYAPISFLFSNIGSYFFGLLLILLGGLLMSPWSIYDISEKAMAAFQNWREKQEEKRQLRFLEQEEKAAQAAMQAIEVDQEEADVDPETGEILDDKDLSDTAVEFDEADYEKLGEYDPHEPLDFGREEETDEADSDVEVEVDFTAKESLDYKLPTINLFAPDKPKNQSKEKRIVRDNIKPAVGVRVNRSSNLADDLALALAAKDVRIEAPIPGKSLVGIEVPNSEVATVTFRELWEQSKTDASKLLEIPLGKAVNGSVRSFDLAKMPHLLVAGSTGSGKSVAVNGIIASILMKARPDEVKFMMVDPKMVELSVYNDIPHLLIPVVTNPRKASRALQKVVDEMENRYELFSKVGARNIAGYNAKVAEYNAQSEYKQVPLPLIVVIVDELADLMMVASKEVEDAIIRLGQKARAAGIHMILATQRPSVDVISGLIKANVPSRIAFAVSSGIDSRTILDENGAEKLLGRGDMLFKPIDENHPVRLQGSFISDEDVERIVAFVKNQAEADYDDSFDPGEVSESDMESGGSDDGGDPLFEEAKALVIETQKASASMIQRRLSVGFNRATRLMEELEAAGVIGPAEGTKPRKVLQTN